MPDATEIPDIKVLHRKTPSPLNPLGVREWRAGCIAVAAAIASAVEHALKPFGVGSFHQVPLTQSMISRRPLTGPDIRTRAGGCPHPLPSSQGEGTDVEPTSTRVGAVSLLAATGWAADGFTLKAAPKIAFLYFKAKNDGGWTQAFDEAKPKIEAALGRQIPFVVENIAEDAAQIRPAAEKFMQRGYNIIIGTAFGYSDTFKELAEKHNNTAFLDAAGTVNGPTAVLLWADLREPIPLRHGCGRDGEIWQAWVSVAANPFGLVNWTINAYELGAKKMNPSATVTAVFTGAWKDP